jgi:hypothetical protein
MICYQLTYLWLSMVKDTYKEAAMKKKVLGILFTTVLVLGIVLGIAGPVGATGGSLTGVSITGTAQVGGMLTAVVTPPGATATYQWEESSTAGGIYTSISGAISATYTPVALDQGMFIEVVATGTTGYSGTETSAATSAVAAQTPLTGVSITGTAQVGGVLTAVVAPTGATVTYQWQWSATVGGTYAAISSATSSTYTPVSGDQGNFIKVVATGTGIYSGSATSAATSAVAAQTPITAIGAITGTAQVGGVLTAGAVTPSGATVNYQWQSNASGSYTNITGATLSTYTVDPIYQGYNIEVMATGSGIYSGSVTSAATSAVIGQTPITAIAPITGTVQVGSVLTAGAVTPSGAIVNYQWQKFSLAADQFLNINGATSITYTPVAGDQGLSIRVEAIGTGIYSGTVTSTSTSVVAAPTVITAIAAITGTAQVGSTLTAGALTPSGATATYQWQESTTTGGTYSSISGATLSTYTPVAGDATYYIEVVATGTGIYSGTVTSTATSLVCTPLTSVSITGTAQVGGVLTAVVAPSTTSVTYQWQSSASGDGYTAIGGATSSTYTPVVGDQGKFIEVVATGVSPYSGVVTSLATSTVAAQTALTGVTVTGTAQIGGVLTAVVAPSTTYVTYQWTESATAGGIYSSISGAAASTYTLVTNDATKYIEVIVTGTGTYSGTVISAANLVVAAPTVITGVTVNGTPQVGVVLTAVVAPTGATVTYQWKRSATSGGTYSSPLSTSSIYTPVTGDVNYYIEVVVNATIGGTYSGTATSTPTIVAPAPITHPTILGVTAPVTGGYPGTTITSDGQYTGSVVWSPTVSHQFTGGTVYTATITLNPKTGYTVTGVAANFFTVAGATSVTNAASSGVITAVFPTTYNVTITLNNNGWTLVSTDNYIVSSGSTTSAFSGPVSPSMIYKYTSTGWQTGFITDLSPGTALYVKTTGSGGQLGLNYDTTVYPAPSPVTLVAGWNLISTASTGHADDLLSSLRYVEVGTQQQIGLATLVSQGALNLNSSSFYVDATNWSNLSSISLNPFDGYWIYMNAPTTFAVIPATNIH